MGKQNRAKVTSKTSTNTCAGKPIRAAMQMFSRDLIYGCKEFAKKAENTDSDKKIRVYNTACILFAISSIEAQLNERIVMLKLCFIEEPKSFWHILNTLSKSLKLEEKWNLIAAHSNSTSWNKGREPFQSFEIINSLRNELVHYKGTLFPKDTAPTKKIKGLMKKFGIKSSASFIEDDCSAWVGDLLDYRNLGTWVTSIVLQFEKEFIKLFK